MKRDGSASARPCPASRHAAGVPRLCSCDPASTSTRPSRFRSVRSSPSTPPSSSRCLWTKHISYVTENLQGIATATRIAQAITVSIHEQTGLTASAGVSYNKFLAKLASDNRKPDGLFVIPPERGPAFVEDLEVGRFHGVGPVTAARMKALGIHTGLDLRGRSMAFLQEQFGKSGHYFYGISRGVDERPVRADRIRKSVGSETTFPDDLHAIDAMLAELRPLAEKVWTHCQGAGTRARTVTLKVKYANFQQITRSRSFTDGIPDLA